VAWTSADSGAEVRLGATRLAVQDLQARANQPMTSADGRFTIVLNGEITNYREIRAQLLTAGSSFRSSGDTEVLLEGWASRGAEVLTELEGFFAFALLDRAEERLVLARDPFGIKPLFIARDAHSTVFASELPSLLTLRRTGPSIAIATAVDYLLWGSYDRTQDTFIEGVRQVEQGTMLTFDLRRRQDASRRFWWPDVAPVLPMSAGAAAAEARELLLESVRCNLRSDVPLGIALSGGLDSSALACAARRLQPDAPIRTFSYVEPGSPLSEERWSSLVAEHIGSSHHRIVIAPGDLSRDLDDLIRAQGEPFGSTSIYAQYRVYQRVRQEGVVVTLDGQGGDELFAGYDGYPGPHLAGLVRDGRPLAALRGFREWCRLPDASPVLGAQKIAAALAPGLAQDVAGWSLRKEIASLHELLAVPGTPIAPLLADALGERTGHRSPPDRSLALALRRALLVSGLSQLLRHGDRNSMHFSVESRVPFLDRRLVTLALGLPSRHLAPRSGVTKGLLREAMQGIVPDAVRMRTDKVGFRTPGERWLGREAGWAAGVVRDSGPLAFLRTDRVLAYLASDPAGRVPFDDAPWRLVNLYRWAALLGVSS